MERRPRTLVTRVVSATAALAAIAGLVGASLASAVAYYFLRRDEDARILTAAEHARYEFVRDRATLDPARLESQVAAEGREIAPSGLVIGVVGADGRILGSSQVRQVAPGNCADLEREGKHFRACAVAWDGRLVVVASRDFSVTRFGRSYAIAALVAAGFSVFLAIAVSRKVVHSALLPLTQLHARVSGLPPMARREALGAPEDAVEVDSLRNAIGELLERQAGALERSRNFAADAAHELRTPLTTLRAKVEILLEEQALAPQLKGEVGAIQREVTRLGHLVERLLVLAMPDEESLPEIAPIPMVDLVEEVISALPVSSRARVDFVPDAPDVGAVRGDAALLELAIANVLDNALKYSSRRIRARVGAADDVLMVEIEDEGPGIPEHERGKLFQPFHRGAATRHVRGHGIGLAIVAKVVNAHNGRISVEGNPGLRVRIELPRSVG